MIEWSEDLPTIEGWYAYQVMGQWPIYIAKIEKGSWQLGQNPEWLYYAGDKTLRGTSNRWFGPIPEPET